LLDVSSRCREYNCASVMRTFWQTALKEMLARLGLTRFVEVNRAMSTRSMFGLK
jgi:hypothetical protein